MARRVFFSFHWDDIFRVNQVRNCNVVAGVHSAGFYDHSEYEAAKRKGDAAIKKILLERLDGTSVTVVLIGNKTATRPWVDFEIEESIKRNNGLLGIYIHHLVDPRRPNDLPFWPSFLLPDAPSVPWGVQFPKYMWDKDVSRFAREIESAGQRSDLSRLRQRAAYVAALRRK